MAFGFFFFPFIIPKICLLLSFKRLTNNVVGSFLLVLMPTPLYLNLLAKQISILIFGIYKDPWMSHTGKPSFQRRLTSEEHNCWPWSKNFSWVTYNIWGPLIMFFAYKNATIIFFLLEWKLHKIWQFFDLHVRNWCCRNYMYRIIIFYFYRIIIFHS